MYVADYGEGFVVERIVLHDGLGDLQRQGVVAIALGTIEQTAEQSHCRLGILRLEWIEPFVGHVWHEWSPEQQFECAGYGLLVLIAVVDASDVVHGTDVVARDVAAKAYLIVDFVVDDFDSTNLFEQHAKFADVDVAVVASRDFAHVLPQVVVDFAHLDALAVLLGVEDDDEQEVAQSL